MTTGGKLGIALAVASVYLAFPVVRRLRVGCPAFAGKDGATSAGAIIPNVCKPITAGELLLWPVGFFVAGK
ncbi:MAG: hypothetical protein JWL95_3231 [Gemmatimonadetes bacterium]|nr:hypothetical protein [Gemmatimonadota bacterium]